MLLPELKPVLATLALPPAGPLVLVLAGAVLARRRPRAGKALSVAAAAALWLLSCQAVAVWLAQHLLPAASPLTPAQAARLPASGVQAIVVLGGGVQAIAPEYGQAQPAAHTISRLRYGLWLAHQTGLPVAFSGGVGWAQAAPVTEAEVANGLAREWGGSLRWLESRSRDTAQNARFTRELLAADGVRHIALVTNSWHMPRAAREFEAQGLRVSPAPMGGIEPQSRPLLEWLPSASGLVASQMVLRERLALWVYAQSPGKS